MKDVRRRATVRGKSFDTFCPLGPVVVTRDEIPDQPRRRRAMTVRPDSDIAKSS